MGLWVLILFGCARAVRAEEDFGREIRPLLKNHCFSCHGSQTQKGKVDLERYLQLSQVVNDIKTWQTVAEKVGNGTMPPKDKPPVGDKERALITGWVGTAGQAGRDRRADRPRPDLPAPHHPP